jgi:UDP-N-acetylmuramoyl-L-alanyl-D-glutamate--2,6-diaminopimelate ligase
MRLSHLLSHVPDVLALSDADPDITAPITEDSRAVQPGGIFVARIGGSFDGHRYIPDAAQRGAAAIVGEQAPEDVESGAPYVQVEDSSLALAYLAAAYHDFPARRLVMIGVTGTDGKTSTTNLIYSILTAAGNRAGMISTIKAVLGTGEADTGLHVTTPTAPEVQAYLAQMVSSGLTHCVLEATSHGLAQHRVAACDFDVTVVTNIQHEHLDFHGSWENYRDAKAMLFRDLMSHPPKETGPASGIERVAVINLDDSNSAGYLLRIPADHHLTYAVENVDGADIAATDIDYGPASTRFELSLPDEESLRIKTSLVGQFNVSNILAAATAAFGIGISDTTIKAGIEALQAVPGRMERVDVGQNFLALVDFAHTPNALKRALETARLMIQPTGRIFVIFGSAGLRDPEKRILMGQTAADLADFTFITAEDPRTESLDEILAVSARAVTERGGVEGETFWRVPDRGEAIYRAVQMARAGDIVLACGKGHEQSMCFGTIEYPWDDRSAMRAALRGAPLRTLPTANQLG